MNQLEPKNGSSNQSKQENFVKSSLWCTIWDDVRTYLTSSIDPKKKAALIVAISHFKKEKKQ